jgi:pyruvate formate lyase activating enzyme
VGELAARLAGIRQVSLLAYHPTAAGKYERLGRPYRLADTLAPADEQMEAAAGLLRSYGLVVTIGG